MDVQKIRGGIAAEGPGDPPAIHSKAELEHQEMKLTKEIEELAKTASEYKPIPLFEWFITLFSIIFSILLFMYPAMLEYHGAQRVQTYEIMLRLMPQPLWAFAFFGAGLVKSVGLLMVNRPMRVLGLVMSALLYTVLAVCYSVNFPTLGAVMCGLAAVFSLISIVMVKTTG